MYGGPIVGGAVYGMSHALLKNYFSDEKKEWCNAAIDVAIEGTIGAISAAVYKRQHLLYEDEQTFILPYPPEFSGGNQLLRRHARPELRLRSPRSIDARCV